MKPRKKPTQRERAELQKEIGSKCPTCGNESVGEFQVHHLNEDPSDNNPLNLLMLCPNCHAKLTNHSMPREVAYQAKLRVWEKNAATSTQEADSDANGRVIQINSGNNAGDVIQVAGNATIRITRGRRTRAAVPTSGVVGTSPHERAYIKYLYDRLFDYKKNIPGYDEARAGRTVAKYVRDAFGTTWTHVPVNRFGELMKLLQEKIDATPIGRKHKKKGTKAYRSFEDFSGSP